MEYGFPTLSNNNNVWTNQINSSECGIVVADQTSGTDILNNTIVNCTSAWTIFWWDNIFEHSHGKLVYR